jgi:hypothetical protein
LANLPVLGFHTPTVPSAQQVTTSAPAAENQTTSLELNTRFGGAMMMALASDSANNTVSDRAKETKKLGLHRQFHLSFVIRAFLMAPAAHQKSSE